MGVVCTAMAELSIAPPQGQNPAEAFVCAWCRASTSSYPAERQKPINFGICPTCLKEQIASLEALETRRKPARVRLDAVRKQLANGSRG